MNESTPTTPPSGRHPVNVGHLVLGVAFLGLASVWALVAGDVVRGDDIRFLLPAPWVLAGAAGLVALISSDRRKLGAGQRGWVDTTPAAQAPSSSTPSSTMEP